MLKVIETPLQGVKVLEPQLFGDNRGFFFEAYRQTHVELGLDPMVQVNISRSTRNVVRGLHYQLERPQAKLISVIRGCVFDVAVDIRPGSPTFGQSFSQLLSDENHLQMYISTGFAHGFCVVSEEVDFLYLCSDYYHPQSAIGVRWNDPALGIEWPVDEPIMSDNDLKNVNLCEIPPDMLPAISWEAK